MNLKIDIHPHAANLTNQSKSPFRSKPLYKIKVLKALKSGPFFLTQTSLLHTFNYLK